MTYIEVRFSDRLYYAPIELPDIHFTWLYSWISILIYNGEVVYANHITCRSCIQLIFKLSRTALALSTMRRVTNNSFSPVFTVDISSILNIDSSELDSVVSIASPVL